MATEKGRVTVRIVRSTLKAHLVEDAENRQGWIQARWLREDSTVAIKTFEKSISAAFSEDLAYREKKKTEKEALHDISLFIGKETEKAVCVQAKLVEESTDQVLKRSVWIPKSQIFDGCVKGWLLSAKAKDLREDVKKYNAYFTIEIANVCFY